MARLWSSGFELNKLETGASQDGKEWSMNQSGEISVQTSVVHGGTYAAKVLGSGNINLLWHNFASADGNGPYWARFYLNLDTNPDISNSIFEFDAIAGNTIGAIYLNTDGSLTLLDGLSTNIGSSIALTHGVWYRVEMHVDLTGSAGNKIIEAAIDGKVFATTSTSSVTHQAGAIYLGSNMDLSGTLHSGQWYYDDVAINDSTGSFQNSWPGDGQIVHLKPSAAGDSNGFLTQVGGTAGSTNNFTRVNEVTPDDATSYNASTVLSAEDLFNVDDSTTSGGISFVAVGVRMTDLVGADATAAFKVELEKAASGTKSQSSSIIPNSTTWRTNAAGALGTPRNYPLTAYQDPDSGGWTPTTLNSMQIGYIQTATNVQAIAVSTVWALVEYTGIVVSDSTATSESVSLVVTDNIPVNDTVTDTDTIPPYYTDQTDVVEHVNIAEVDTFSVSDTVASSESVIMLEIDFIAVSSSVTAGESTFFLVFNDLQMSDSLSSSESLHIELIAAPNIVELQSVVESTKVLLEDDPIVSDSPATAESIQLVVPVNVVISDTSTVADSPIVLEQSANDVVIVSDTVTSSESVNPVVEVNISVSETIATSESLQRISLEFVSVFDTATASESITVFAQRGILASDSVVVSDPIVVSVDNYIVSVSDTTSITEFINFPGSGLQTSDTTITSEFIAINTGRAIVRTGILQLIIPSAVDFRFVKKDV